MPDETYDSRPATRLHIARVQGLLREVQHNLWSRGVVHDQSKLESPEREIFDEYTPKLPGSTYGSPEYVEFLAGMKVGLDHHYAHNSHHPEYWPNGIHDMDLLDLTEMLADWKAATERHDDGDLGKSILMNRERFGYGDEIEGLLRKTAERMGWL